MVLASFAEGLPVVIMESLAMGRPVISTAVMGIPELVIPRETGWLVPPANPAALAEAMAECLAAAPSWLTEMGSTGRVLVAERHDAIREASRLLKSIRQGKRPIL
jgi:glycosyltransferase involved in cell wall biosynthesis